MYTGVIFVHDLSQRRTKSSLQKWAVEIATIGTFSAPLGSGGPGGLPVPYIVIGNKADIAAKEGTRGSSGNLVDVARQWVEKQGLLSFSEEIPLTDSFPGGGGLLAVRSITPPSYFSVFYPNQYLICYLDCRWWIIAFNSFIGQMVPFHSCLLYFPIFPNFLKHQYFVLLKSLGII